MLSVEEILISMKVFKYDFVPGVQTFISHDGFMILSFRWDSAKTFKTLKSGYSYF